MMESKILDVIECVESMPEFHNGSKARALKIMGALRGYLTEYGTTSEQDVLLYDIGVMTQKPMHYDYWKARMDEDASQMANYLKMTEESHAS